MFGPEVDGSTRVGLFWGQGKAPQQPPPPPRIPPRFPAASFGPTEKRSRLLLPLDLRLAVLLSAGGNPESEVQSSRPPGRLEKTPDFRDISWRWTGPDRAPTALGAQPGLVAGNCGTCTAATSKGLRGRPTLAQRLLRSSQMLQLLFVHFWLPCVQQRPPPPRKLIRCKKDLGLELRARFHFSQGDSASKTKRFPVVVVATDCFSSLGPSARHDISRKTTTSDGTVDLCSTISGVQSLY
uniref:Uncharacterized protein n=1 Tax=Sphaerodactylus townsendi TaxID=933632 RepID=A0ACB8EQV8_9SAUR